MIKDSNIADVASFKFIQFSDTTKKFSYKRIPDAKFKIRK
jgi:hypothetical protein